MIVCKVRNRDLRVMPMGPVTTGSVGLPVSWHFDEDWDDLQKIAVFSVVSGGEVVQTAQDMAVLGDVCIVPEELLAQAYAGKQLRIGVYGSDGSAVAIPTIYAHIFIQDGAEPENVQPGEGTPSWAAQIQGAVEEAVALAQSVRADADTGELDGVSPAVTASAIERGHSVTITDRDHPNGQSFDVLDGASAYEQAVAGGYEGTEAQFNAELAAFKDLSEQAASAATAAASSATAAAGSATAAAGSATDAAGSATQAASSETAAAGSASNAASSATSASGSATAAASSATAAANSATAAGNAKTAAEAAQQAAEGSATAAGSAQTAAAGSASDAATAKTAAEAAQTAAANSATSAASSATAAASAQNAAEAAQTAAEAAAASLTVDSALSDSSTNPVQNKVITAELDTKADESDMLKAFPTGTASGAVASFEDGADGLPLKKLVVNIEPAQSGSGDPSPGNIRPISGWTGCNIYHETDYDVEADPAFSISWQSEAGTVYGGALNPIAGELVVDRAFLVFDGSEDWNLHSTIANWFSYNYAGAGFGNLFSDDTLKNFAISNLYVQNTYNNRTSLVNGEFAFHNSATYYRVIVKDIRAATAEEFKALLANQNLQFVIKLVTPITYQLTPVGIKTLLGQNNIWADTGDVSVEYCADPTLYIAERETNIQSAIAPIENGSTASQAYAQGAYFFRNGVFCKAKTAIASGAAFTLNTNYEVTTVAAELFAALNS